MENMNIIGDCVEAVYHEVARSGARVPLDGLLDVMSAKTRPSDYEIVKNVAKGGYGEVFLVKRDKIYAMKRVSKELVLKQPHTALFMSEKQAMVESIGSEWLVCAHLTMQDEEYLYYLMDFIPGGDFMGLLSKEDVLEEDWVRFYAAEMVAALDELHTRGWIHRDLKPDNILIGADGHIRLADFGSCIRMKDGWARSSVTVGTPDYVSPDVLCSVNEECEYGEDVDFWTLGVIVYEMVYGTTPFYSDTLVETYRRITRVDFGFPFKVSEELTDLIMRLIAPRESRMCVGEIKSHVFFADVDWERLRERTPPFVPEINGELDTSHFVDTQFDPEKRNPEKKGVYIPFVGFTFDPGFVSRLGMLVADDAVGEDRELERIRNEMAEAREKLEEAESGMERHQEELKDVLMQLLMEKEELEMTRVELERCRKHLRAVCEEISERRAFSEECRDAEDDGGARNALLRELSPFIHLVRNEAGDMMEVVCELQEAVTRLSMENKGLQSEVAVHRERSCEMLGIKAMLESENKSLGERLKAEGIESLKRQLRMRAAEAKEYEQKLDQEILFRKKVEEELGMLRKERTRVRTAVARQSFSCCVVGGEQTVVRIEEDRFWIGSEDQNINNVYVGELRPNELHHLVQKKRPLTLRIVFMAEEVKSISSSGRRSLKSLEEDLNTELAIRDGIEKIRVLLKGKTLDEANMQLEGSNRKIGQLRMEIEKGRKSTLVESIPDDPVKMYEFNNHLFAGKTVPQGTFCDFCNEVLYGLVDQGFECRDCKMVVHRACYVLGDVSCELYSALRTGKTHYVTMRTVEEKERLLAVNRGCF